MDKLFYEMASIKETCNSGDIWRKARKRAGMSRTDDIFFSGVQSSRFFFGNGA